MTEQDEFMRRFAINFSNGNAERCIQIYKECTNRKLRDEFEEFTQKEQSGAYMKLQMTSEILKGIKKG